MLTIYHPKKSSKFGEEKFQHKKRNTITENQVHDMITPYTKIFRIQRKLAKGGLKRKDEKGKENAKEGKRRRKLGEKEKGFSKREER